jgi:hypothetical protein
VPVRVALPRAVRQVFQGGTGPRNGQTVAILANGSVWAWGDNDRGQLGDGTKVSSDIPLRVDVPRSVSFVTVSSGWYASYAIDRSGRLWAWAATRTASLEPVGPASSPPGRSWWESDSPTSPRRPRTWLDSGAAASDHDGLRTDLARGA